MTSDKNIDKKQKTLNEIMNEVKPLPDNWREILEKEKTKNKRLAEWRVKHGWKDNRIGTCKVCGSQVKPDVSMQYDPSTGPMIIGPGSRNQFKRVHKGFYCVNKECNLMYKDAPSPVITVEENPFKEEE